jgi:IAA-amino acid hydrolase
LAVTEGSLDDHYWVAATPAVVDRGLDCFKSWLPGMAPWSAVLLLQALAVTVVGLQGAHAVDIAELKASARSLQPWLKQIRRELHQFPELMYEEHNTSARIRQHLDDLGILYKYPYAKTGVVGRIGTGKPIIALRADIDALPVQEPEGLAFVSKNSGRMHACGHDGELH